MIPPPDFLLSLFPADVAYVWGGTREPVEFRLAPEEAEIIAGKVSARRREEFTLGRACAHQALIELAQTPGVVALPMPTESGRVSHTLGRVGRAPDWPKGVVGAITHSHGAAAAAVARGEHYLGVGLDIEPESESLHRVASRICRPEELKALDGLPEPMRMAWLAVTFSIKESIFKALNPATGIYLGFQDALVYQNVEQNGEHRPLAPGVSGNLGWQLLKDCGSDFPVGFTGPAAFQRQAGWVLTGVWLPGGNISYAPSK